MSSVTEGIMDTDSYDDVQVCSLSIHMFSQSDTSGLQQLSLS